MKLSDKLLILKGAAFVAIISFALWEVGAVFGQSGQSAKQSVCISNLKQIDNAIEQYATDHDGVLPIADSWQDAIWPALRASQFLCCPNLKPNDRGKGSGYAFNRFLSHSSIDKWKQPELIPLVFESNNLAKNANEYLPDFPSPGRHSGTNLVLFLDGSYHPLHRSN